MRNKDRTYLRMAHVLSDLSTCIRRKVGCVIVDADYRVLATGYNGVPRGHKHCTDHPCAGAEFESGKGLHLCLAIHAEQNALMQVADIRTIHTIFCTTMPCEHCLKMIQNTGCKRVVFTDPYPSLTKLDGTGISFEKMDVA